MSLVGDERLQVGVDLNLEYIEAGVFAKHADERASAAALTVDTVFGVFSDKFSDEGMMKVPVNQGAVSRYMHPGLSDTGDIQAYRSPERQFLMIDQGSVWRVPCGDRTYMAAGLSDCSLIVGYTLDGMVAGHVSYTGPEAARAVMEDIVSQGVRPTDTFIVSGLSSDDDYSERQQLLADLGIPTKNAFINVYDFIPGADGRPGAYGGLARVVATNSYIAIQEVDTNTNGQLLGEGPTHILATGY